MSDEQGGDLRVPSRLSPSSLDTWLQCPLRFKFSRIDKIPEKKTEAQIRGILVHEILEHLFKLPEAERTEATARGIAKHLWDTPAEEENKERGGLTWREYALKVLGREDLLHPFMWNTWWHIEEYFRLEDPTSFNLDGLEDQLEGEIAGVRFTGIIDRWRLVDGAVVVSDYKTGKIPQDKYLKPKLRQLVIYKLLYEQVHEIPVSGVELIYLKQPGKKITYEPTTDDKDFISETVSNAWDEIRSACQTGEFETKKGILCNWCSFKSMCPAWTRR